MVNFVEFDDLLGLPFADRANGPRAYSCYGLVREVYRRYGRALPKYPISAMDAVKIGQTMAEDLPAKWIKVQEPLPVPCLVVIQLACGSWANHVGVYIGDGQFIHAYKATGVVIDRLKRWRVSIVGFYVPR